MRTPLAGHTVSHGVRRGIRAVAFASVLMGVGAFPTTVAAKGGGTGGSASKTRTMAPPAVSIASPGAGSTLTGTTSVKGSASSSAGVASVQVRVDSGALATASGTTTWSWSLDTTTLSNGSHTITAVVTDTASHTASTSVAVSVTNSAGGGSTTWTGNGVTVTSSAVTMTGGGQLTLVDRGAGATWGTVTATLCRDGSWNYYLALRDSSDGATSLVALPGATSAVVGNYAHGALNGLGDYWLLGGGGPVTALEWTLTGSPLPTSATPAGSTTWGDQDSRAGALLRLASGGILGVWRQQGATGPQGFGLAYRAPAGGWSTTYPLQFMPTASSKQALAQNPADGSIWLFNDPDAFAAIGAAHLTEGPSGISVDWTNATFIDDSGYGGNGPDPENPDLEAAPDAATGTVALAYESQTRQVFSTSPWVVGSYPVVARIAADASKTFTVLPVYVERITTLGLVVDSGQTWLAYRPVDPATLSFDTLYASRFAGGTWTGPAQLGTVAASYEVVDFGVGSPGFDAVLGDGTLHHLAVSAP